MNSRLARSDGVRKKSTEKNNAKIFAVCSRCSRSRIDVHFCFGSDGPRAPVGLSPLFEVQPQIAQEYAPYSILPSMIWRAPVFPHTWDVQAVVPFTLEETRAPDRTSKPK